MVYRITFGDDLDFSELRAVLSECLRITSGAPPSVFAIAPECIQIYALSRLQISSIARSASLVSAKLRAGERKRVQNCVRRAPSVLRNTYDDA